MTLREFEEKIQKEINKDLKCLVNYRGAPDCAGVYWGDEYLGVAISSSAIYNYRSPFHTDSFGNQWRSLDETIEMIKNKLEVYQSGKKSTD